MATREVNLVLALNHSSKPGDGENIEKRSLIVGLGEIDLYKRSILCQRMQKYPLKVIDK